jgi:hypothetical protein
MDLSLGSLADGPYRTRILDAFRTSARQEPVVYMDDIRKVYGKRARGENVTSPKEYLEVLTARWGGLPERVKLTVLHYCSVDTCELPLSAFSRMVGDMLGRLEKVKVDHGTMVGLQAAQSISERFMQMTLNSFHSTGCVKAGLSGVSRIKELLSATKAPKIPILGPLLGLGDCAPEAFFHRTLKELCIKSGLEYKESIRDKRGKALSAHTCFFTLRDARDWAMVKNCRRLSQIDKSAFRWDSLTSTITCAYAAGTKDDLFFVKSRYAKLCCMHVAGLHGAEDYVPETGMLFFAPKVSMADTVTWGDLFDICPTVDLTRLRVNDLYFIQQNLGIEAARSYLVREIISVLALEGISVATRHITLLVDNMTNLGAINPNTFRSIDMDESIILKSTFERATEVFCNAAAEGVVDKLKDVSSQILLGQLPRAGVSYAHLVSPPVEREIPIHIPLPNSHTHSLPVSHTHSHTHSHSHSHTHSLPFKYPDFFGDSSDVLDSPEYANDNDDDNENENENDNENENGEMYAPSSPCGGGGRGVGAPESPRYMPLLEMDFVI